MSRALDARAILSSGPEWTARIAPLALPILLWVARQGQRITYTQLAEELHARHGEEMKFRKTLYGRPVGAVGEALEKLAEEWGEEIPPANVIVVEAVSQLPRTGADAFITRYINHHARRRLTEFNRVALTEEVMQSAWDYPDWDRVARHFGHRMLEPVSVLLDAGRKDAPIALPPMTAPPCGQGESAQHRQLKRWAAAHPAFFARFGKFSKGRNEYLLRSGDSLDAYLDNRDTCLAIEVKASNAPESELFRGIFQCVKYRATLRAMQLAAGEPTNAHAALLITRKPSTEALRLAKRLRVELLVAPLEAEHG